MPGLVIGGREVAVKGVPVRNFIDDPAVRCDANQRRRRRTSWVRSVCLHTTRGIPGGNDHREQDIRPGAAALSRPGLNIAGTVRWINRRFDYDGSFGAYHVLVDHDGTAVCIADIEGEAVYHASALNEVSVGVSMYQGGDAELYEVQLEATRKIVDAITLRLGIQRQVQSLYQGPFPRARRGDDLVGVFGHRDQSSSRGPGDPGDAIVRELTAAGYEGFDFNADADRDEWRRRQRLLNKVYDAGLATDGVPGPATVEALKRFGFAGGLWAEPPEEFGALQAVMRAWKLLEDSPRIFGELAEWFGVLR